jgi:hypothetical protein
MAAAPGNPYTLSRLLRANSEQPLPNTDVDVIAALDSYGAAFKKAKKEAPARLELLAGLMWVHAVWSAASVAQHRALATAICLDYDLHAASGAWHTMVVRKVLSCIAPGATPEKRKAPDSSVDGQIKVPGGQAGAQAASPVSKKHKSKASTKLQKDSSSSSGEDSSTSASRAAPAHKFVNLDPPASWACMPDTLGFGTTFSALVAAKCPPSTVSIASCGVRRRAGLCGLLISPRWHWLPELASRARMLRTRTRASSRQPGPTGQGSPSTVSLASCGVLKGLFGPLRPLPPPDALHAGAPHCSGIRSPPVLWLLELASRARMLRFRNRSSAA